MLNRAHIASFPNCGRSTPCSNKADFYIADLFDRTLAQGNLTAVFQPIVCPSRRSIFAYEGLIRGPADTPLYAPPSLFEEAVRQNRLLELDLMCRKTIINEFARQALPGQLFININPLTLLSEDFVNGKTLTFINQVDLDPSRVVIEITETHHIDDIDLMQEALLHYRNMGFRVALDDLGAGYSGLTLWSQMNPEFVKIDRHFTTNIDEDATKRQFVKSILEMARFLGCKTITEGVETSREYEVLQTLGSNYLQGFYFGKPCACPARDLPSSVFLDKGSAQSPIKLTAAHLIQPITQVNADTSIEEAGRFFDKHPGVNTLAVTRSNEPIGLLLRNDVMSVFDSRFGRDLYGRNSIHRLVNQRVIMVSEDEPLEKVSQLLTTSIDHYTEEFIITSAGQCVGKGSLLNLLRRITEQQIYIARFANPLTLLPGNIMIQHTLSQALNQEEAFALAYFDLDGFKSFNDAYGYSKGDEVVQWLAMLIIEYSSEDFVGHIGGDDFIVVYRQPEWKARCQCLLKAFKAGIQLFYSTPDKMQGGVTVEDRYGLAHFHPFLSLSIGAVAIQPHNFNEITAEDAFVCVSHAKHQAKQQSGNTLVVIHYGEEGHRKEKHAVTLETLPYITQ